MLSDELPASRGQPRSPSEVVERVWRATRSKGGDRDGAANLEVVLLTVSAAGSPHLDVARLLLERGADVEQADEAGWTPLMVVCQTGPVEAVELLLKHNAEISRATRGSGSTPLHIALQNGHLDAARLLLERGAEVDQVRKDGTTALRSACKHGLVDVAQLLLGRGADAMRAATSGPGHGMDALAVAKHHKQGAGVALLEEHYTAKFPLYAARNPLQ